MTRMIDADALDAALLDAIMGIKSRHDEIRAEADRLVERTATHAVIDRLEDLVDESDRLAERIDGLSLARDLVRLAP